MRLLTLILVCCSTFLFAQLPYDEQQFIARLKPGAFPEKLLTTRTVVFHSFSLSMKELELTQKAFQRTGIDAVAYFESDLLAAGRDISVAMAGYLNTREIGNLAILQKNENGYTLYLAEYNRKANLVEQDQAAWTMQHKALDVILQELYRTAANSLKRENMLINDYPETGMMVNPINGRRSEFFAIDLKVDELAVPKFGNEAQDKALEEIMKTFPHKYKLTEANLSESELRKQGFLYVLRFVHARDKLAKNVLGYDMTKSQSAIVSVMFNANNETQLKNIPANTMIYKFYFKHIETGNVFLGTKWDADENWQQALINQIKGYRTEFKIN